MILAKNKIVRFCFLFVFSMMIKTAHADKAVPGDETKVVDEIYKETYHFHFKQVDSLILANDLFFNNNLKFNLAVVNYYWWRLISAEENSKYSRLVSNRIEKIKADFKTNTSGKDDEQLFLLISIYAYSARVSLLDYSYYSALNDLSHYYSQLKMSFGREEGYRPFYLTSGLYYFFAGYAREKMPLLSPILYYYTPGSMLKGIQYIKTADVSGDWKISQEAKYFLMKINYDVYGNYTEAAKYCNQLMAIYPENLLFQTYMFRISLALDQVTYAKARLLIMETTASNNVQLNAGEKDSYIRQAKKELEVYYKKKK
jgi:hypothetical protein